MGGFEITVTMFLMAVISVISLYADSEASLKAKLIFNPYKINRLNQYYRFITSGFIHSGLGHLFSNMFVLYFFGTAVEKNSGMDALQMVLLFVLGVIVASIPTFFRYKDLPHYNALGASGGVSSVLFFSIIYDPIAQFTLYIPFGIPFRAFIFGAIYLAFSYYMDQKSNDNVNHNAHLYGALFGIAYAFIMIPDRAGVFFQTIAKWFTDF